MKICQTDRDKRQRIAYMAGQLCAKNSGSAIPPQLLSDDLCQVWLDGFHSLSEHRLAGVFAAKSGESRELPGGLYGLDSAEWILGYDSVLQGSHMSRAMLDEVGLRNLAPSGTLSYVHK